jgi:glutamine amidotransferase
MQLLMERSYEFGEHRGLGIIKGSVVRFSKPKDEHGELLKIPQVGWNTIYKPPANKKIDTWNGTLCEGVSDNAFMYFVHSYYPELKDGNLCLSLSRYGNIEFCSSFAYDNIFACQFHPERSGFEGLKIYRNLAKAIKKTLKETVNA